MKQKKYDVEGMSLKEYRDNFGKEVSLDVLKRVYGYSQIGHLPPNALSTAVAIYAEPFKQHNFLQLGLMAEKELNAVTIWNLQTETVTAQRALLSGEWDFHNRAMCIARLGENYVCTRRTTLDFPSDLIIGVYEHRHRFAAVVSLEQKPESVLGLSKVQEVADIMAKNALAYYPEYLELKKRYERMQSTQPQYAKYHKPEKLVAFLLQRPLRFVKGINNTNSVFYNPERAVTVDAFLKQRGEELKQQLNLVSVELFGDFEHL